MTDIVERLRAPLGVMQCEVSSGPAPENKLERRWLLALEAAAEIERLRAALRPFADVDRDWPDADPDVECGVGAMFVADGKAKIYFRDFHAARAALKEEGDD